MYSEFISWLLTWCFFPSFLSFCNFALQTYLDGIISSAHCPYHLCLLLILWLLSPLALFSASVHNRTYTGAQNSSSIVVKVHMSPLVLAQEAMSASCKFPPSTQLRISYSLILPVFRLFSWKEESHPQHLLKVHLKLSPILGLVLLFILL